MYSYREMYIEVHTQMVDIAVVIMRTAGLYFSKMGSGIIPQLNIKIRKFHVLLEFYHGLNYLEHCQAKEDSWGRYLGEAV